MLQSLSDDKQRIFRNTKRVQTHYMASGKAGENRADFCFCSHAYHWIV